MGVFVIGSLYCEYAYWLGGKSFNKYSELYGIFTNIIYHVPQDTIIIVVSLLKLIHHLTSRMLSTAFTSCKLFLRTECK